MTQSAAPGQGQELGRISRPGADQYRGRRKLILLPLLYSPATGEPEGAAALQNYWQQAQTQVAALENALGGLQRIYHESVTEGASGGLEQLRAGDLRKPFPDLPQVRPSSFDRLRRLRRGSPGGHRGPHWNLKFGIPNYQFSIPHSQFHIPNSTNRPNPPPRGIRDLAGGN